MRKTTDTSGLKPFQKGQTGNPGGRPKLPPELKAKAREFCEEALREVVKILRKKKATDATKVRAAELLFDRGYGRPETTVNVRKIKTIQDLSEEELQALAAEAEQYSPADRTVN